MASGNGRRTGSPRPLHEQTVVITGASSGIGRSSARWLAACGARVVLTARRAEALDALVRRIERGGGTALAVPGDVTSEADLRAVARAAVRRFGGIDTWINNAAVYIQGRVQDLTLDEYRRVLDVDLVGYINGTRCALEAMQDTGRGGIIQVSSILAKRGAAYTSAYAAAKAGLDGFTQSLRTELVGSGIRISTIYLPPVDTPVYRHARAKLGTVPKPPPPVSDPADVARAIAVLAVRTRPEWSLGAFARFYTSLPLLPARAGDWLLHHLAGLTRSDLLPVGDNLDRPLDDRPRMRDGWRNKGWRGLTLRETIRVLPWETAAGVVVLAAVGRGVARRLA
jgi:NAD(P)-dependent dehydrogenase (short-subunit alcohol dehydrogenase family)